MPRPVLAIVLLLLLLSAGRARADILMLEGGGRVEGVVTERGDAYVVKNLAGSADVPKDRVVGRVVAPYITEVYERRLAALDPADPDGHYELSLWCERGGMRKQAREHLLETIRLAPDHAAARARLGHVRFEGTWMSPEEAKAARLAKAGLVPFEGRWYTPEGLAACVAARKEMALLREEEAARQAKREEAERKRAAEAAALARAEEDRRERDRLERENDELRDLVRDLLRQERDAGWGTVRVVYPDWGPWAPVVPFRTARDDCFRWRPGVLGFRWSGDDFEVRGRLR